MTSSRAPKPLVLPKAKGSWPKPPTIDAEAPFPGDEVHHPTLGTGRFGHVDWVDGDGRWVNPTLRAADTRRDTTTGHWQAHVTTEHGAYDCPLDELTKTVSR